MAFDFPASPTTGQEYLADNGRLYLYDGTGWTTLGDWQTPNRYGNNPYKYRTIYTRGYVAGGYQSSSPWSNVNRTTHYNDTTANLGDIMDRPAAYTDGGYSDYNMYIYAASTSFPGTGTWTTSINMATEAGRTHNTDWDTKLDQTGSSGYGSVGTILNASLTLAWILGGQTNIEKHNYVTEVMYSSGRGGSAGTPGEFIARWYGRYYGWVKHTSTGNRNHKIEFATDTWSAAGVTAATDGWAKALSTKDGFAYVKNTTYGINYMKIDDTTGSSIHTTMNASDGSSSEENYENGQNWGYCLGHYNGAQNNNSFKIVHATDTIVNGGAAMQPKGHGGMSSACCGTASNQILGGY